MRFQYFLITQRSRQAQAVTCHAAVALKKVHVLWSGLKSDISEFHFLFTNLI
jgi:hypothetical protein